MSIFRSAITGSDGTVDPGYLALYWAMAVTVAMIPLTLVIGFWLAISAAPDKKDSILVGTAAIIGALGGQCAATIAAVGAFRAGDRVRDRDRDPKPQTV